MYLREKRKNDFDNFYDLNINFYKREKLNRIIQSSEFNYYTFTWFFIFECLNGYIEIIKFIRFGRIFIFETFNSR